MNKQIEHFLAHFLPEIARIGIQVLSQREIDYGLQLRLGREGEQTTLNIYHSEKKGISTVLGKGSPSQLKLDLERVCEELAEPRVPLHEWESWIGSDECGKGDYFGALVVAAFAADEACLEELRALGVKDSKKLRDSQIKNIALALYERFRPRIACVMIKPLKYNEIIADMQSRGQNLNDLLAWQHGTAIQKLLEAFPLTQGVLVDQFSNSRKVRSLLKARKVSQPVEERHDAERDAAVAAASIIARYQFLQQRESMNRAYGIKFPLGAGKSVLKAAQEFADKFSLQRLAEVAKLHFVTSRKVQEQDIFPS